MLLFFLLIPSSSVCSTYNNTSISFFKVDEIFTGFSCLRNDNSRFSIALSGFNISIEKENKIQLISASLSNISHKTNALSMQIANINFLNSTDDIISTILENNKFEVLSGIQIKYKDFLFLVTHYEIAKVKLKEFEINKIYKFEKIYKENHSLIIYCGYGSGLRYFMPDEKYTEYNIEEDIEEQKEVPNKTSLFLKTFITILTKYNLSKNIDISIGYDFDLSMAIFNKTFFPTFISVNNLNFGIFYSA